jgi:hypothetical protein
MSNDGPANDTPPHFHSPGHLHRLPRHSGQPNTATSWLSMPLTMTIMAPPPQSELPPAPWKRRYTLPGQPTAPLQPPQLLLSCPKPRCPAATSQPTTVTYPAATMPQTTTWASSSTQTTADTSETATHAPGGPQQRPTAHKTPFHAVVRTRSPECVVHSTERVCQPHCFQ